VSIVNLLPSEKVQGRRRRGSHPDPAAPRPSRHLEKGCLQILEDGVNGVKNVVAANIKVASDFKVWLRLDQPAGLHVFCSRPDRPPSEWELSLKDDKTAVSGDPPVLYETDSRFR
jgi:hypothetical protein